MVRLITHNLLACHAKNCTTNNFPLQFKDVTIELRDAEFNGEFLKGFMPKIEWKALVDAARQVNVSSPSYWNKSELQWSCGRCLQLGDTTLPPEMPEMVDDEFLKNLHHVLLEVSLLVVLLFPLC